MEQTTTSQRPQLEWRDMLSAPASNHTLLAAVIFFLSCLALPLADNAVISALFLLSGFIFYYALTHSILSLAYYALPVFLLYGISGLFPALSTPLLLPCAFLAFLLGGGSGAFLLIHFHDLRKYWYVLALPLAAYGSVALITGDPLRGLLALLPFAVAVVAAIGILRYTARTEATVMIAATIAALLIIAGIVTMAVTVGLDQNPLSFIADYIREATVAFYIDARELYAEIGMDLGLTDVTIDNTAAMLVNVIPGLFFCICGVTAFLVWRTLLQLLVAFRTLPRLPARLAGFTMSTLSAGVFLLTYIISIFANSSTATPVGIVCQNIALVLEPGLALIGFASLFARGQARSCLSYVLLFVILFVFMSNPATGLALVAFFGAFHLLALRFMPKSEQ